MFAAMSIPPYGREPQAASRGYHASVTPLAIRSIAPRIPAADRDEAPHALLFFNVTCPVCRMAAPKVRTFEEAYPGRIVAIGQDPPDKLSDFDREFGLGIPAISDAPPYPLSDAFGIEVVPTLFALGLDREVVDVVQSWDREGMNRASGRLADLLGAPNRPISEPGEGLPSFRPG
jgi:hypothetical protein